MMEIIGILLVLLSVSCSSGQKVSEAKDFSVNSEEIVDTLFSLDYSYSFDVTNVDSLLQIAVVGSENKIYFYENNLLTYSFHVENPYYLEHILVSPEYFLFGNGAYSNVENIFLYNKDQKNLYNGPGVQFRSIDNNIVLCWGDYSRDKEKSNIDKMISYHYLFDLESLDTIFKFGDGQHVAEGENQCYFELNTKEYVKNGGSTEVSKYIYSEKVDSFYVNFPKNIVPMYFTNEFYLMKQGANILIYDFDGNQLNVINTGLLGKYKFIVENKKIIVYGWMSELEDSEEFFFVRKRYDLD